MSLASTANNEKVQALRIGDTSSVAVSAVSANMTVSSNNIIVVRVVSNIDCHISSNATATVTDTYLPEFSVEYFCVEPGEVLHFIRATAATSDGYIWVSEIPA
jgi:hypothetical protein